MGADTTTVTTAAIGLAVAAFRPYLEQLIQVAEGTGKPGPEKRAAVSAEAKALYEHLASSGAIKELRAVPWPLVEPIVVGTAQAGAGLVAAIVGLFNRLLGKLWGRIGLGG